MRNWYKQDQGPTQQSSNDSGILRNNSKLKSYLKRKISLPKTSKNTLQKAKTKFMLKHG